MKTLHLLFLSLSLVLTSIAVVSVEPTQVVKDAYASTEEVFVKAEGAELFCRVKGQGAPILVIHGGPGLSQDYLLPQMLKLGDKNKVIFYDQRACGRSTGDINEASINLENYLADIEAIRKAFKYEKITVLGHSWGGLLAMEYAIKYQDRVEKLILMNTAPASQEEFTLFLEEWAKRMAPFMGESMAIQETSAFKEGDPKAVEEYFRIMFATYCYDPKKVDLLNLYMPSKAFMDGVKVSGIFRENLLSKPFDLHGDLKKLQMPVLIIHGVSDVVPPVTAESIHKSIAGSKFILIERCGHFPYVEAPEELFRELQN